MGNPNWGVTQRVNCLLVRPVVSVSPAYKIQLSQYRPISCKLLVLHAHTDSLWKASSSAIWTEVRICMHSYHALSVRSKKSVTSEDAVVSCILGCHYRKSCRIHIVAQPPCYISRWCKFGILLSCKHLNLSGAWRKLGYCHFIIISYAPTFAHSAILKCGCH